jgi:hypothetical protein
MVRGFGKRLVRTSPVGVTITDSVTGSTALLRGGVPSVTVRGLPSEVTLYMFGRRDQARVELLGNDQAVARLKATALGV